MAWLTLFGDRRYAKVLKERARAALATLAALPRADAEHFAAIGFYFGGTIVLELARTGTRDQRADWHSIIRGNTLHGFTNPAADGLILPTARYHHDGRTASYGVAAPAFLDDALGRSCLRV